MQIYNSMTRKKEPFVPLHEGKVGIYACGPTVYNFFHIGNARPFIVFDVLRRYLEYRGYEVTFVQNFTDIDDKMIRRANEEGVTVAEIAERYIAEYFTDAKALGIRPATVHPRATEHIPQIIALIQRLIDKGLAYESQGDVYYRVRAFPSYGCLCGQNLEDLESGARVSVDEVKEDPLDFALWKAQKPGEPAWESPWGMGRPGWHIECSAMSTTYLGETFDIHGGGKDLLFPHHENEIAQTSGAPGKPYVRYWMHNGFINIDNERCPSPRAISSPCAISPRSLTWRPCACSCSRRITAAPSTSAATSSRRRPAAWSGSTMRAISFSSSSPAPRTARPTKASGPLWTSACARRKSSSPPWMTTSTPPTRWPRCLSWCAPSTSCSRAA